MLAMTVSSCLGTDEAEYTLYNDTAISAVTLGTMTRTLHTLSSTGEDSTYTKTYSGSAYTMFIDHANGLIYNADSLPTNTTEKMLMTISAKNGGGVYIKNLEDDEYKYVNSADSIDVSQPRSLRVVAQDLSAYREYKLEVRIHKEEKNVFTWQQMPQATQMVAVSVKQSVALGNGIVVAGVDNNGGGMMPQTLTLYSTADGKTWTAAATPLAADAHIVGNGETLFAVSNGKVYASADAANWTEVGDASHLKSLLAATPVSLYALDNNGGVSISADGGASWAPDVLGDDASLLPTENISAVCKPHAINDGISKIVVVGCRNATLYPNDKTMTIWSKIDGDNDNSNPQPWFFQPFAANNEHKAPLMKAVAVTAYDNGMLMLGTDADMAGAATLGKSDFQNMLFSVDYGLTWNTDERFVMPDTFECGAAEGFTMVADKNNFLWIVCGKTGQVWRGHLSHLLWGK